MGRVEITLDRCRLRPYCVVSQSEALVKMRNVGMSIDVFPLRWCLRRHPARFSHAVLWRVPKSSMCHCTYVGYACSKFMMEAPSYAVNSVIHDADHAWPPGSRSMPYLK